MNRLLALDVGMKRIGVAMSDPLGIFAVGHPTINRLPEPKAIDSIKKLCIDYAVSKIIVGFPVKMNGKSGAQVEDVENFVEKLKQEVDTEIVFQDERLSSVLAQKILIEQNISPSRNKGLIDQKAAELILQQYLDSKKL